MKCFKCGESRLEKFYPSSVKKNHGYCKQCYDSYNHEWERIYRRKNSLINNKIKHNNILMINSEPHKRCFMCKTYIPLTDFHKNKSGVDGLAGYCKQCNNIKQRIYYQKHKEKCRSISYKSIANHKTEQHARTLANYRFPSPLICEVDSCGLLGERHHDDYSKPYEIRWLCRKHHSKYHKLLMS